MVKNRQKIDTDKAVVGYNIVVVQLYIAVIFLFSILKFKYHKKKFKNQHEERTFLKEHENHI